MFGSQTRQVLGSEPAPKATAEAPQESETTMAAMETDWLEPESPTGTYDTFGSETMAKAAQALATSHIVNDKSLEFKNNLKLKVFRQEPSGRSEIMIPAAAEAPVILSDVRSIHGQG